MTNQEHHPNDCKCIFCYNPDMAADFNPKPKVFSGIMEKVIGIQEQQAKFMDVCTSPRYKLLDVVYSEEVPHIESVKKAMALANGLINEEVNTELRDNVNAFIAHYRYMPAENCINQLAIIADDMVDSIYVILQLANAIGIRLQPVWEAVQVANTAKAVGPDGKVVKRGDGKIMKPEGWKAPDIVAVIRAQLEQEASERERNDIIENVDGK